MQSRLTRGFIDHSVGGLCGNLQVRLSPQSVAKSKATFYQRRNHYDTTRHVQHTRSRNNQIQSDMTTATTRHCG